MTTETELAVVGMVLTRKDALGRALALGLSPSHFDGPECRDVYAAVMDADRQGKPYTAIALGFTIPHLAMTMTAAKAAAPVSLDVEPFVRELIDAEWARRTASWLGRASKEIAQRKPWDDVATFRRRLEDGLTRIIAGEEATIGPRHIVPVLDELYASIEKQIEMAKGGNPAGIPTGFDVLDSVTGGGLPRGGVATFAARTGVGKSTLAINILRAAAFSGHGCAYFSVEMLNVELMRKLLSREAMVAGSRMRIGDLDDNQLDRIVRASKDLHGLNVWFDDTTGARFEAVERAVRQLKRRGRLDMIVVDYVQQFRCEGRFQSSVERVSEVSSRLKQLAIEHDIAVVSIAQLNRGAAMTEQPAMHQIKDAGAIEQDSDIVCLLSGEGETMKIFIAKNRHGRDGKSFDVRADLAINLFANVKVNLDAFR